MMTGTKLGPLRFGPASLKKFFCMKMSLSSDDGEVFSSSVQSRARLISHDFRNRVSKIIRNDGWRPQWWRFMVS